ncbi:MAG: chemotaxis protein CheX [Pseudomonadota bacterium]
MDVRLINPFITATMEVLGTMAFTKVDVGKPYIKKERVATGDVSGVIGLTGYANGTISVSFTEACILKIVSNMLGEPFTSVNADIKDAVGEITNMISGQARKLLDVNGFKFDAAIPTVIVGKNHEISHITHGPMIALPFNTADGPFTIEVCFDK